MSLFGRPSDAKWHRRWVAVRGGGWQTIALLGFSVGSVGLGWLVAAPTLIVVGPLLAVLATAEHRRRFELRYARAVSSAMPLIVDRLIHQLRAGHSLGRSCLSLGTPVAAHSAIGASADTEVLDLIRPLTEGLAQRQTLAESARRLAVSGDPAIRLFAVTVGVLADNGGPAVPALQRLRHTLIGVVNGQQRADAEAAQALASAGLLVSAPSLFAALVASIDRDLARFYLSEPLGAVCVLGSVMLSWAGWWWMQRHLAVAKRAEL